MLGFHRFPGSRLPCPRTHHPTSHPSGLLARLALLPLLALILPWGPAWAQASLSAVPEAALSSELDLPLRAADDEADWLRYPAISPDGQTIAFTYRGDLYRVSSQGGEAMPLTTHTAHDFMPVWSPDGAQLVFASYRYGNFNLFLIPAEGGEARRLTWHSADEFPYSFTPDGEHVLFGAARLESADHRGYPTPSQPQLYQVSLNGDRPIQRLSTPAEGVTSSQDGSFLLYHDRKGGEDPWRKHQRSAITRDIWRYDIHSGEHTQLTDDLFENRHPVLVDGDGAFVYLSEESGSFNVHRMELVTGQRRQLTRFQGAPVRFLSGADDGTLAFSHHGRIHVMGPDGSELRSIPVRISLDRRANDDRVISVSGGVDEFAVSPDGTEVAFVFRGDVFVASVEAGTTKRITDTPAREVGVEFSPDGEALIYASERDGRWGIYEARRTREEEPYFFTSTLIREEAVQVNDHQNFQPRYSPDGSRIAFIEDLNTLRVLDRSSGEVVTLLTEDHIFATGPTHQFEWSPDGEWILFTHAVPGIAPREIGVVRTDGTEEPLNLTRSGFQDTWPTWVLDGKAMLWRTNRDGRRALAKTGPTEVDAYAMFFDAQAWSQFQLSEEEIGLLREREEEDNATSEVDEPLELDLAGARDRRIRLTIHSSAMSDALLSQDGDTLYYLARFEGGLNVWSTNTRTRETRRVAELDANSARMTWDGEKEKLFILADGRISTLEPGSGSRHSIPIQGEMVVSASEERGAMFDQVWRRTRDTFYTRTFHDTDWDAAREEYERFLPHIGNLHEFAELLGEMLGELNVSHSGARYAPSESGDDATASLGVFYDQANGEEGLRITEIMAGGPMDRATVEVEPGAVIAAIDGQELTAETDPARLLNRKADQNVLLEIREGDSSREVVVKPITLAQERSLRYQRWVERNRAEVKELSDGRLGYVHIPGMNDGAYRSTFEEVMGRHVHAEGLVVDTRFNGGGDLVADLEMFLSGTRFFDYTTDTRSSGFEPNFRWTRPSVTLANEANYSDGHCFAWAYQTMEIGPLIGMPVPGTCTFGGWQTLLDGLRWGVPGRGVKDTETGRYLENWQTEPDIQVSNEPAREAQGRDQQLERAVEELLRLVDGG